jgi:uncharacterized transporter YbjL
MVMALFGIMIIMVVDRIIYSTFSFELNEEAKAYEEEMNKQKKEIEQEHMRETLIEL